MVSRNVAVGSASDRGKLLGALCNSDTIVGPCSTEDVQGWGRNCLVAWGWQQQWCCLFFISSGMLPIPYLVLNLIITRAEILFPPVYLKKVKKRKSFQQKVLFLIFLLYCILLWKVVNWLLFVLQMDPVQKAVINHTFGVSIPPKKKQVISCNVCQLRFNSDVSIGYFHSFFFFFFGTIAIINLNHFFPNKSFQFCLHSAQPAGLMFCPLRGGSP